MELEAAIDYVKKCRPQINMGHIQRLTCVRFYNQIHGIENQEEFLCPDKIETTPTIEENGVVTKDFNLNANEIINNYPEAQISVGSPDTILDEKITQTNIDLKENESSELNPVKKLELLKLEELNRELQQSDQEEDRDGWILLDEEI